MSINTELLEFVSVEELLGPGAPLLRIPDFHRPYSWTPRIAAQLFTDVGDALNDRPEHPYIMGTVILLRRPDDSHFEVVDGQQRLLTLHLLRAPEPFHLASRVAMLMQASKCKMPHRLLQVPVEISKQLPVPLILPALQIRLSLSTRL